MLRNCCWAILIFCVAVTSAYSQNVDYIRLVPAGGFRTAALWSPFNPGPNPPLFIGPGGATDSASFNLGVAAENRYTIFNVTGVNNQLIIRNDALELQFADYETVSADGGDSSIIVGLSPGDVGDVVFTGGAGSDLQSHDVSIGRMGAIGRVSANGPDLFWSADDITVGARGDGLLMIENGAFVANSSSSIASGFDSFSSATVRDASSEWFHSGTLTVGSTGDGDLFVLDGGRVSNTSAIVGQFDDSQGSATVTGEDSFWVTDQELILGRFGDGSLSISDGGQVSCCSASLGEMSTIGFATGSGNALISGSGSTWDISEDLTVGDFGNGTLRIENGGNVSTQDASMGSATNSIGTVTVAGTGSTWTINILGVLVVGESGDGLLEIIEGGTVCSSSTNLIGVNSGAFGVVNVDGAGSTWMAGVPRIGGPEDSGDGEINIRNGGAVIALGAQIEGNDPFDSFIRVTGPDSLLMLDSNMRVGTFGRGRLFIFDSGTVDCGDVLIATNSENSEGRIVVENGSQLIVEDDIIISGFLGNSTFARGELSFISDTTVSVGDTIQLYPNGTVEMAGGTLFVRSVEFINGGGSFEWRSGTLHVESFGGDLETIFSGRLAPGSEESTVGSTTIFGDYTQPSGGTLEIEIGGTIVGTEFDFVNVADDATLDGTLELLLGSGFTPDSTNSFTVFNASNIFGFFDNVSDNQRLDTVDGMGSFLVRYGVTSPNPNQVILSDFEPNFILGDVNGDGVVNLLDVAPFVELLTNGGFNPAADINMDGVVNLLDVGPFVALLAG